MVAVPPIARKTRRGVLALFAALTLAACDVTLPAGGVSGPPVDASEPVTVALLIPQSMASEASRAQSLENAARLAVRDIEGATIDLKVYDTGGTGAGASAAATRALNDGAQIFVGPFFSEAAVAASVTAQSRGVNVLAFSNNASIAGGNLFILGNTFQTAADRLTRYAARQGRGDVFVVHANSLVEEIGRDAIMRAVQGNGARLAGTAGFPLSQQGVIDTMPSIASQIRSSGATSVFITSNFDGALGFVAELLPENGVSADTSQFIALQSLNNQAATLSGLQGAWFALPDPARNQLFEQRYQSAFGSRPDSLAGLAYDGVAAVGALVARGGDDALSGRSITQGSGFAGVYGPFRFFPNGTNERALAVAEIRNNQVNVIDPAPRSFGAGF